MTNQEFFDLFLEQVGDQISELVREPEVTRWGNAGMGRLPARYPLSVPIAWAAGDTEFLLPADFVKIESVRLDSGCALPSYQRWGQTLQFLDPAGAAGSGTLFYYGLFPMLGSNYDPSPVVVDAALGYALYRFYRRMASSRADFRRYTTITGQAGLDVSDLETVAEGHRQDFVDARLELEEGELSEPAVWG